VISVTVVLVTAASVLAGLLLLTTVRHVSPQSQMVRSRGPLGSSTESISSWNLLVGNPSRRAPSRSGRAEAMAARWRRRPPPPALRAHSEKRVAAVGDGAYRRV
jgi:hypothetical protein